MSNLKAKLQQLGPGILMATAAIGGSHLVASTQAGALFGWQLWWLIVAVNVLKYPFFRFGVEYTLHSKNTLVQGYFAQGKGYFYSFMAITVVAAIVNTAGVLLLSASLLHYTLGAAVSVTALCFALLAVCLAILLVGHYHLLDKVAKGIMVVLVITTLIAFFTALINASEVPAQFVAPNPYQLASLGFIVVLMGWMPAPIEISVLNSLWLKAKCKEQALTKTQGLFDFNLGYVVTAILALLFFALGALIQFGKPQPIELAGVAFSKQLIEMYTQTIGQWAHLLVSVVAFLCMFGTTITVLDGYARALHSGSKLIAPKSPLGLPVWLIGQSVAGLAVVLFFKANLGDMLTFAMTLAFLTTPVFAWLNYRLIKQEQIHIPQWLKVLSWVGLAYLLGFSLVFIGWKLI